MEFTYTATDHDGAIVRGTVSAGDTNEVLAFLTKRNLSPIGVRRARSRFFSFFNTTITASDQVFISKYLSLMLRIGTGLLEAVNILLADYGKRSVQQFLEYVRTSLEEGKPFHTAFAKYEHIFGAVYVNLVRAGESSGNLQQTFENITDMITRSKELRDRVRSALIYPTILLLGSILVLSFLVAFALPKIAAVFADGGLQPPAFSRVVFALGGFLATYGGIALGIVVIAGIGIAFTYRRSVGVQRFLVGVFGEVPGIRDVIKKIALQRFAYTFASLLKAGVPITDALEISASAGGNIYLAESLRRIAAGISGGLTVGAAFRREPFFPLTVSSLVSISEKAGHLSEVLFTVSDFYAKEVDTSLKTLVSVIEPILLVVIGSAIGTIALAVVVPIYQLTTAL